MKVTKRLVIEQLEADTIRQEKEIPIRTLTNITALSKPKNLSLTNSHSLKSLFLKDNNQVSIILTHNLIFYIQTKYINIQFHYIYDVVASGNIDLQYISISEMIANGLIKALTQVKLYFFIEQIQIV